MRACVPGICGIARRADMIAFQGAMSLNLPYASADLAREGPYYLQTFDRLWAPRICGWVAHDAELFWLAPKTFPPLTAAKVVAWAGADGTPCLFMRDGTDGPLGYLEVNPMPLEPGHLWLGHCLLNPDHRGIGLGQRMVRLALQFAFDRRRADRISLVVFPENTAAVCCYRNVGFVDVRNQVKYFHTTGRRHVMLEMTIDRTAFGQRTAQPDPIRRPDH